MIDVAALLEYAQAATWEATYPKLSRACPKRGISLLVLGIAGFQSVPADASVLFGHWRLGGELPRCFQAGAAGTGKSHLLVGLGHAAVHAGLRVRFFVASDLVETLYRGIADNSVGKVIDNLLRADLVILDELGFAPLDLTGTQLLFRFIAAAYERRALGIASHWPFDQWGRFLPEPTTATSMIDRLLHHSVVVVTEGESYRLREARSRGGERQKKWSPGGDFHLAISGDFEMAIDMMRPVATKVIST